MRPDEVSEREAEVLSALSGGLSNAQISHRLHISVRTVESHVSSLLRKYGVGDRRALVDRATEHEDHEDMGSKAVQIAGLPASRTSFVGRDRERDALLVAFERSRLVTVVGPGGVGKTRLVVEFATSQIESYSSGAFIDLVPVRSGYVAQAVAAALGVAERPQQTLEEAITRRLGRRRSLIILDSCEHLLDETAGFVDRTLSTCPGARFLMTSRERLALPGERTVPVPPLPPADADMLFADRARTADPEFKVDPPVVADLCARLDGIPLAIELAAARSASLGAAGLLAGLDDVLRLLAGERGPDERHRSLRAVIGWSYDLLEAEEQRLFRRLSVFVGGFDLDAAVAVTALGDRAVVVDLLAKLVDKSLVHRLGGGSRWRMLDTIRAFAAAQPDLGDELNATRERHLEWASETAVGLAARNGSREDFDLVIDDLRAAALRTSGQQAHQLSRALGRLTFTRRFLMESLGHFEQAAICAPTPADAARDLRDAAGCAHFIELSGGRAMKLLLAAAEQARLAGDGDGRALALARAVEVAARCPDGVPTQVGKEDLLRLLDAATAAGNPRNPVAAAGIAVAMAWTTAREKIGLDPVLAEAAVEAARATGNPLFINSSLDAMRTVATNAGRLGEAHRISSERRSLLKLMDRDDPSAAAEIEDIYSMACTDAIAAGDLSAAVAIARQAEQDDLVGSHPYLTASKIVPALVLTGAVEEALRYAPGMWDAWVCAGSPAADWLSPAVSAVALAYGLRREDREHQLWRARAVEVVGDASHARHRAAFTTFVDVRLAIHNVRLAHPDPLVDFASGASSLGWYETYARAAGAELAVVAGLPDRADRLSDAGSAGAENAWAAACLARAAGRLHHDIDALRESVDAWERIGARWERACTLLLLPGRAREGAAELSEMGLSTPTG